MKRKRNWMQKSAVVFLILSLLLTAFSGALAEGEQAAEEQPVEIPILQETQLLSAAGKLIGTLVPDGSGGADLQLETKETVAGVIVRYAPYDVSEQAKVKALTGKTKVLLSLAAAETAATEPEETAGAASPDAETANTATPTPETTPEPTKKPNPTQPLPVLPEEGWIDSNLVNTALYEHAVQEASACASAEAELAEIKSITPEPTEPAFTATPVPENDSSGGIFSPDRTSAWLPLAAVALGIVGAGMLAWIAFSAFAASSEARHQTDQLRKLSDELNKGIEVKSPVKVEQAAWPREGSVTIASEALEQLASRPVYAPAEAEKREDPPAPPPKIVPPGEDPELLALCNRLAGVASAEKWHSLVKEAGWHAVLLQTNPTEKGTYIPDESGYSIVACLMRDADAEIAFVLPSYQDPNASEERWSEFFAVSEDFGVKNFRVDALAEMFIERGTFFLLKSKGRLTHRPQFF